VALADIAARSRSARVATVAKAVSTAIQFVSDGVPMSDGQGSTNRAVRTDEGEIGGRLP
jgi:hypothetical protein